ncbi:MAG: DUF502 domain-containing protein [Clostridia bacterium]|nr:DUF502 domain-containing protein [Clostridia bacterium]
MILFLIRNIGAPASQFVFIPLLEFFDKSMPSSGIGKIAIDFFSMLIVFAILTFLGAISQFIIGKMMISVSEKIINKIPFVGKVYKTVKQIVDTFSKQNKAVFQKAVLIEFPRNGVYSVGFLTSQTQGEMNGNSTEKMLNVFVPTTPNPTSGFLMAVPEKDVIILDMSVGDAMKLIISGGAVAPNEIKK